jgi:hypothetical protein
VWRTIGMAEMIAITMMVTANNFPMMVRPLNSKDALLSKQNAAAEKVNLRRSCISTTLWLQRQT